MIKATVKLLNFVAGFIAFGGLTEIMIGETEIALIVGIVGAFLNFYSVSKLLESSPLDG